MTAFKKLHIITWAIDIIQKALWLLCVWRFATDFLVALPQNLHMLLYCKLPFSAITSGSLLILDIQACNKIKYIFPWFLFFSFYFSRLPDACKSCQDIPSHADAPVPDFGRRKGSGTVQSVVAAGFFFFFFSCQASLSCAQVQTVLVPPQRYSTCLLGCTHPCCLPPV